jgi:xylose isomerase
MDCFARGLRNAVRMIEDGLFHRRLEERYSSFSTGLGLKIDQGSSSLEECEEFVLKHGEPEIKSGKQEQYEAMLNYYV